MLVRKLIDRLGIDRQAGALGPGVSQVDQSAVTELALNIEVPLLHVAQRLVRHRRANAEPANQRVEEGRVSSGWHQDSIRERIRQATECSDAAIERGNPRSRDGGHDILVGRDRKRDIIGQPEDAVARADHGLVVQAVCDAETGRKGVAVIQSRSRLAQIRIH